MKIKLGDRDGYIKNAGRNTSINDDRIRKMTCTDKSVISISLISNTVAWDGVNESLDNLECFPTQKRAVLTANSQICSADVVVDNKTRVFAVSKTVPEQQAANSARAIHVLRAQPVLKPPRARSPKRPAKPFSSSAKKPKNVRAKSNSDDEIMIDSSNERPAKPSASSSAKKPKDARVKNNSEDEAMIDDSNDEITDNLESSRKGFSIFEFSYILFTRFAFHLSKCRFRVSGLGLGPSTCDRDPTAMSSSAKVPKREPTAVESETTAATPKLLAVQERAGKWRFLYEDIGHCSVLFEELSDLFCEMKRDGQPTWALAGTIVADFAHMLFTIHHNGLIQHDYHVGQFCVEISKKGKDKLFSTKVFDLEEVGPGFCSRLTTKFKYCWSALHLPDDSSAFNYMLAMVLFDLIPWPADALHPGSLPGQAKMTDGVSFLKLFLVEGDEAENPRQWVPESMMVNRLVGAAMSGLYRYFSNQPNAVKILVVMGEVMLLGLRAVERWRVEREGVNVGMVVRDERTVLYVRIRGEGGQDSVVFPEGAHSESPIKLGYVMSPLFWMDSLHEWRAQFTIDDFEKQMKVFEKKMKESREDVEEVKFEFSEALNGTPWLKVIGDKDNQYHALPTHYYKLEGTIMDGIVKKMKLISEHLKKHNLVVGGTFDKPAMVVNDEWNVWKNMLHHFWEVLGDDFDENFMEAGDVLFVPGFTVYCTIRF